MTTNFSQRRADRPLAPTKQRARGSPEAGSPPVPETPIPAIATPDLAAEGRDLGPSFPLELRGTGLVLYVGSPGVMRVHWSLDRDDFEQAAASFPLNSERPAAVVRLRRERLGAAAEFVDEYPLELGARNGAGETSFHVPVDHGLYRAELGLTDGGGGWLMLARSNGHYNSVGVGLDLPTRPPDTPPGQRRHNASDRVSVRIPAALALSHSAFARDTGPVGDPSLGEGPSPPVDLEFPIAPILRGSWPASSLTTHAAYSGPADLAAPAPWCMDSWSLGEMAAGALLGSAPIQSLVEAIATAPGVRSLEARGPDPDRLERAEGTIPGDADGAATVRTDAIPGIGMRVEPLTYERPPLHAMGLELEAELRIHGRAVPNSTIDLFGLPYRVGPGGRFFLVLRVEDPELLRQALEAAPPPELQRGRDG